MKENISFNLVYKAPQQRWYLDSPDIEGFFLGGKDLITLMADVIPVANDLIEANKITDVPRIATDGGQEMKQEIKFHLRYHIPEEGWYFDSPDIEGLWLWGKDFTALMRNLIPAANYLIEANKLDIPKIKYEHTTQQFQTSDMAL